MADIDEWLDHGSRNDKGSGRFLSPKKLKDKGSLKIWLHMARAFPVLWFHDFHTMVDKYDGSGQMVFRMRFNCWEDPKQLEDIGRRYYFNDEEKPAPKICPLCLLIEYVYQEVTAGRLDWLAPVFTFDDGKTKIVFRAAMLYGGIRDTKKSPLSVDQLEQLARLYIKPRETFKYDLQPVEHYLFTLVTNPADGIQLSFEKATKRGAGIGTKMNRVVRERLETVSNKDLANPTINPYPFLWKYDKDEEDPKEKYRVIAIPDEKPSDEILKLIRDTPPPPIDDLMKPGNIEELEMAMRSAASIDLPWDEIFGPARALTPSHPASTPKGETKSAPKSESAPKGETKSTPPVKPSPEPNTPKPAETKTAAPETKTSAPTSAPEESGLMYECDACDKPIGQFEFLCRHCGATYDADGGLKTRPCLKCKKAVDLTAATATPTGEKHVICGACATIHAWKDKEFAIIKDGRLPSRSSAAKPTDSKDNIPFG